MIETYFKSRKSFNGTIAKSYDQNDEYRKTILAIYLIYIGIYSLTAVKN